MLGICWWALFTMLAVWAQYFIPGIDFLAPGILVSLQEERPSVTAWLVLFWILLQEGMGSLFFGSALLLYGTLILAFYLGRAFFDPRSLTLMCFLGGLLGICHFLFTLMILRLENMVFLLDRVFFESVAQAVLLPLLWFVAHWFFPQRLKFNERSV